MNVSSVGTPAARTATMPKIRAITAWPAIFAVFDRPSDRRRRTLMKSSMNPSNPRSTVASSTEIPAAVTVVNTMRVATYAATIPAMITVPPIVGVPIFSRWVCGPSSRIR